MAGAHAILAPSAAHRWMGCAAAPALCKPYPESSSIYAAEGTAMHQVSAECLTLDLEAADFLGAVIQADGYEFTVDAAFAEAVQTYVDAIRRLPGVHLIEQKLDLAPVYGVPDQFGTGDAVTLDADARQLSVDDAKFGAGEIVYAKDNEQLLSYAAAALIEHELIADWETVRVAIHQPRYHGGAHYDEHIYAVEEVRKFMERARSRAATAMMLYELEDIDLLNTMAHPGPKQCRWCPHKANCVALANYVHESVYEDFEDVTTAEPGNTKLKDPTGFPAEVLAAMLERVDVIVDFAKLVQAEALKRLEAGLALPGFKLVRGRKGARQWSNADEAEAALKRARLKADEMYNRTLISPAQAEKLLKAKPRTWNKVQALITQKDGALHVAPESDKRPAVTTAEAFKDVSNAAAE